MSPAIHICLANWGLWARNAVPIKSDGDANTQRTRNGVGLTIKVLDLEDTRSGLGSCALELWRVNLNKSILVEVFSEELADSGLYSENSLVRGCL